MGRGFESLLRYHANRRLRREEPRQGGARGIDNPAIGP